MAGLGGEQSVSKLRSEAFAQEKAVLITRISLMNDKVLCLE